ncbi:hypothetical protein R1sor_000456 [Riccia sorocarpa]|uniref:Reverse transcriptase domain-containing protein n=1 Tax=Riccia sorocarpa TaxID=122646 RepID=A0ABD3GX52_9MARC
MPLTVFMSAEVDRPRESAHMSSAYFKADYLLVEESFEALEGAWKNLEEMHDGRPAIERFTLCWAGLRKEIKQKQYEKMRRLHQLPEREKRLKFLMELNPEGLTEDQQREVGELTAEIRELESWRLHRWRLTSREKFLRDGDANTAYFFQKFKKRRARIAIDKIKREDGSLIESPEQIKLEVLRSYTHLYSRQDAAVDTDHCTRDLLSSVQSELSAEQRLLMDDTPTEKELEDALSLLPQGKSPGIDGLGKEVIRRIRELQLGAETRIIVNDDTAVYVQLHEQSARNLFQLLESLQTASGGKTNWQKSKALVIGRNSPPPPWLHDFGVQIVGGLDQTRYLGASLATRWKGVDNGPALLASVTKKAQRLTSPLLSFEARTIGLKHADREGNQKRSLVRWEQKALPEVWGGLGIFELQRFQQALFCKTVLKAIQDPLQTLWVPVLCKRLLQMRDLDLGARLTVMEVPNSLKGCPVATLILNSWVALFTEFRWRPSAQASLHEPDIRGGIFLLARTCVGHQRALEIADAISEACSLHQIRNLSHLKTVIQSGSASLLLPEFPEAPLFLPTLLRSHFGHSPTQFDALEWKLPSGEEFQLGWRGKKIYEILLGDVGSELADLYSGYHEYKVEPDVGYERVEGGLEELPT